MSANVNALTVMAVEHVNVNVSLPALIEIFTVTLNTAWLADIFA